LKYLALKDQTDEELMRAYQLGDESAFKELYSRHAPRVLSFVKKRLGPGPQANDVFQSTFLKLHRTRGLFNSALPFKPWLFTICRNEILDAVKKRQRSLEDLSDSNLDPPDARSLDEIQVDLSSLTADQQKALQLRYSAEASFEEIAKTLKTSPSNARMLVSRSLRALRRLYEKK
jgi:RNA polymerase sigma-70 factor (ECF subfamily)